MRRKKNMTARKTSIIKERMKKEGENKRQDQAIRIRENIRNEVTRKEQQDRMRMTRDKMDKRNDNKRIMTKDRTQNVNEKRRKHDEKSKKGQNSIQGDATRR